MSEEKKIAREIEKDKLLKRLAEIDKEEEIRKEQEFLFDDKKDVCEHEY
jgi:hypothetical protein